MGANGGDVMELVLICLGLIAATIIFWVVLLILRKHIFNSSAGQQDMGFSMNQIDELYQRGELSEDEYREIKNRAALKAANIHLNVKTKPKK
jgi:uncharacterized membrane protein